MALAIGTLVVAVSKWAGIPQWHPSHFELHYRSSTRRPDSFRIECLRATEVIATEANGLPLAVFISGGIDGEVVARSFLEFGKPFALKIFQYKKHRPDDLHHAHRFAKQFGIDLEVVPFDEEVFFATELPALANKYSLHAPFAAVDLKRMRSFDGYSVFGAGDIVLERHASGTPTSYEVGSFFQPEAIFRSEGGLSCYQFFQATPELILSFLGDPILKHWIELHHEFDIPDSRTFKSYMYRRYWPDLVLRKKWTGYERFSNLYLKAQAEIGRLHPGFQDRCDTPLDRMLSELEMNS